MESKNAQELDALFAKRAEQHREAAEAAEARRARQQAFLDRFYMTRSEIMVPAMRAFGE
ncbi:MAG: hypothetical protein JO111_12165, partial [Caulobacteraceae bacterium]|nr:hypothetical protein [Caulobacteraceae bacterium]